MTIFNNSFHSLKSVTLLLYLLCIKIPILHEEFFLFTADNPTVPIFTFLSFKKIATKIPS